jgi:predicted esterase
VCFAMSINKSLLPILGALILCIQSQLFGASVFERLSDPNFVPGKEVRVDVDNEYIGGRHFLVYVPTDYTDQRDWPVIFYYHGMNCETKTWPFRQITNGKGFIIVGMEYIQRGKAKRAKRQYIDYLKRERRSVLEVRRYLCEHLRVDEKRFFITGSSKGGWHTSSMLEISARAWAGAVILAAGRHRFVNVLTDKDDKKALHGKPIYIGAGEKDVNLRSAKRAVSYYRRLGADVTFEEYKGAGHAFEPARAKKLYDWLIANSTPIGIESSRVNEDKSAGPAK